MKAWHPATRKNQEKKMKAEQEYVKAKKQQEQYAKQYRQEMAELEEKRQLEREKEWRRKQVQNREKERKAYMQDVGQKTASIDANATTNTTTTTTTASMTGKKKSRRGRRSKKKDVATKKAVNILSSMGAIAKQDSMDFMYVAPPGLKEAQDKEEQQRSQKEREEERSIDNERKDVERRMKREEYDAKLKAEEDVGGASKNGGFLVQCGTCNMFGHSTGANDCPFEMARVKREKQ
mmetsp:Transcript_4265/g.16078  ORF Transcript_4265/g.16078 Transcript_4265/m.16078 type:complete len:235 (-) Transcript_4265:2138-2842(-)